MKPLFLLLTLWIMALLPLTNAGAKENNTGRLVYIIEPVFNGEPLQLGDKRYVSAYGDTLFIDLMRFYISNLQPGNDIATIDSNSHLVDVEDSLSRIITIDHLPAGRYTCVNFIVGVDSLANISGAMGGDLDPVKGMYWAWNTGYIMAKLEGHAAVCKTIHQAFEFHIGGYLPPYNAARQVKLITDSAFEIKNNSITKIIIKADIARWLSGNTIDLSKTNSVVMPGKQAMEIAITTAKCSP